jgi:tetratricopeptide (TPR) repeat protein
VDQLTAALADRYRIERELGRGGMATVYLAQDLKHDRPVALKVLHPEIAAGLGTERFLREIRLTARLQHPHILPVFDSGGAASQLWYTMPYVRGESLRDRLRREVQLPVETALEITCQVALALEYAHRAGVVHRDIKPENVLLSDGQAHVADFGVARAIGAAGEESLTAAGLAIGTPAYMAPEQASGGQVDGRVDVYALGSVLYEMLAGEPPFTGPTPQAIVAKRFAHPAPSLLTVRPSVPRTLDEAIHKALAPVPADRFATAAQFAQALGSSSSPRVAAAPAIAAPARRLPRRRLLARGMFALAALAVTAGGALTLRALGIGWRSTLISTGVLKPRERLLIADFQSRTPDSTLGLAVTDAFRTDFAQSSVVTTLSPPQVAEALERMQRPATTRLDPVLAREVAIRQGIKAMVTGEVSGLGKAYMITAQLVSPQSGEVLVAERETAEDVTRIVSAVDRLSKRLRERIGESLKSLRAEPPLDQVTTNSLQALEKYNQALYAAHVRSDAAKAVTLLEEAVALDTGFAAAYRSLGGFLWGMGERDRSVAAYEKALQHRDRLTDQERDHTLGLYYQFVTGELEKAIATYRAVLERHPTDSLALGNLSVLYLHLGQPAQAESLAQRVMALDSLHPRQEVSLDYLWVIAAQVELGRRRDAELTYARMAQQYGDTNNHVGWVAMMLPSSAGDFQTAEARAQLYKKQHPLIEDQQFAARQLAALASAQGRVAESERYLRGALAAAGAAEGRAPEYLEYASVLGFLDIWFRRQPQRGLETVEAALRRFPLASLKPMDRPYLPLAFAYAAGGRPQKARALLTEYEREVKPIYRRGDESQGRWTWGAVAMAEGRFTDAIGEFQAFAVAPRDCQPCGLAALGEAYDRAGQLDSAVAVYERYVTTPDPTRLGSWRVGDDDATQLAPAHKRLGELYEQRGDRERARDHYTRFVKLWKDCDPDLRPAVTEVKQRLRQLGGEGLEAH